MQTTEITQQNPQISKTNVLWGKKELFLLWESLSVLVASELFIFSGTFLLSLVHFFQLLGVLCLLLEKHLCKCLALSQWIIFDVGEMSMLGCVCVYIALQKGSSSQQKPAGWVHASTFLPQNGLSHWPLALSLSWSGSSLIQQAKEAEQWILTGLRFPFLFW